MFEYVYEYVLCSIFFLFNSHFFDWNWNDYLLEMNSRICQICNYHWTTWWDELRKKAVDVEQRNKKTKSQITIKLMGSNFFVLSNSIKRGFTLHLAIVWATDVPVFAPESKRRWPEHRRQWSLLDQLHCFVCRRVPRRWVSVHWRTTEKPTEMEHNFV